MAPAGRVRQVRCRYHVVSHRGGRQVAKSNWRARDRCSGLVVAPGLSIPQHETGRSSPHDMAAKAAAGGHDRPSPANWRRHHLARCPSRTHPRHPLDLLGDIAVTPIPISSIISRASTSVANRSHAARAGRHSRWRAGTIDRSSTARPAPTTDRPACSSALVDKRFCARGASALTLRGSTIAPSAHRADLRRSRRCQLLRPARRRLHSQKERKKVCATSRACALSLDESFHVVGDGAGAGLISPSTIRTGMRNFGRTRRNPPKSPRQSRSRNRSRRVSLSPLSTVLPHRTSGRLHARPITWSRRMPERRPRPLADIAKGMGYRVREVRRSGCSRWR